MRGTARTCRACSSSSSSDHRPLFVRRISEAEPRGPTGANSRDHFRLSEKRRAPPRGRAPFLISACYAVARLRREPRNCIPIPKNSAMPPMVISLADPLRRGVGQRASYRHTSEPRQARLRTSRAVRPRTSNQPEPERLNTCVPSAVAVTVEDGLASCVRCRGRGRVGNTGRCTRQRHGRDRVDARCGVARCVYDNRVRRGHHSRWHRAIRSCVEGDRERLVRRNPTKTQPAGAGAT